MLKAEEVLQKVNNDIVIQMMEEHGSPVFNRTRDGRTGQECLWFRTICHGGDSHKLCYFTQTKDFFCYTSCGRMTFWDFVKKINGYEEDKDFFKAVKYIADKLGIAYVSNRYSINVDNSEMKKLIKQMNSRVDKRKSEEERTFYYDVKNKAYDPTILGYFDRNTFYDGWIKEGISIESMKKFGISWYEYQSHIIIPHYDIDGNLIGIRRRSLKEEDANNKYMPECVEEISYEHSLGLNLYGLYQNKKAIKESKRAIIVEGEKSVLLSDTYYGDKSITVATCGFNISGNQFMFLKKLGVCDLYIAFDKDYDPLRRSEYEDDPSKKPGYLRYKEKLDMLAARAELYGMKPHIVSDRFGYLDIKDSPFDKGKEILEKLLSKSESKISE